MTDTKLQLVKTSNDFIDWFRLASPYINLHRGKTFVVMLPGNVIRQKNIGNIISDISLLSALGVRLVVVHGSRAQIEAQLVSSNSDSVFHKGQRITTREDLTDVLKAVGEARFTLEAQFSSGLPDSPMYGSKMRVRTGNFVTAMPIGVVDGIDHQLTGKVRSVDAKGIESALSQKCMVLLSPIGYSLTGETFNLSFDEVAVRVALALEADKLIAFNDDGYVTDKDGKRLTELTLLKSEKFLLEKQHQPDSNTYFSLKACHKACDGGVSRAHIVSSLEDGSLLKELFTRDGHGTMVYRDAYETIRRATPRDIIGIMKLIAPYEQSGVLVKRSREVLETEIDHFMVMEKDNLIIGCAALYPIDESCAELACVVVHDSYRNHGHANMLLTHIENRARDAKINALYVLTTQTAHWFVEQGFKEITADELPHEKKDLYNYQRASKIYTKELKRAPLLTLK